MAVLQILTYPDTRLRRAAKPIHAFDDALAEFVADMLETMYDAPGVGLAATQVGDTRRVAVIDCGGDEPEPLVLCNPEILTCETPVEIDEGCLSVPGYTDRVERYQTLRFRAQDQYGAWYERDAADLLAQCVQHEIAHLDGGLYIDKLSRLKRARVRRRIEKTGSADGGRKNGERDADTDGGQ